MSVDALWISSAVASTRPHEERRGYFIFEEGRLIAVNSSTHAVGTYRVEGQRVYFRTFAAVHDPDPAGAIGASAMPFQITGVGEINPDGKTIEYVAHIVERPEVTITGVLRRLAEVPNFRRASGRAFN